MNIIDELEYRIATIETTPYPYLRITIDTRRNNPYADKKRLQFWAHKARRHFELDHSSNNTLTLRLHSGQ